MDYEIQKSEITSSKIKEDIIYSSTIYSSVKAENITILSLLYQEIPCEVIKSGKIMDG